jgi:putative hydrolase of the HAD superfamily
MDVDVVFLDAGNTLIRPEPSVGEVYADALRSSGVEADTVQVGQAFERALQRARAQRPAGKLGYGGTAQEAAAWWRRVVRESFEPFGRPREFESVFQRLWDHFARGAAWAVYDDVFPALGELAALGKRVGLISNWDVRLERVLHELGLWSQFDWVVISSRVGVEKPDPAIFRHAVHRSGVTCSRAVHVGDNYEEDVVGARRAGLRALWLRRGDPSPDRGVVHRLTDVPALLRGPRLPGVAPAAP